MPNKRVSINLTTRRLALLMAALLTAGLSVAFAQTNTTTPPAAPNPVTQVAPDDDTEPETPRQPEAPIDTSGDLSTLEYEPTESISEDKSVAFPIDI